MCEIGNMCDIGHLAAVPKLSILEVFGDILNPSQVDIHRRWRSSGTAGSFFKYGRFGLTGATKPIFIAARIQILPWLWFR